MKDTIVKILKEIMVDGPDDIETCDTLIDDGYLDSFDIVSLVGELNDEFDVNITVTHLIPENFNSVDAIADLIKELS